MSKRKVEQRFQSTNPHHAPKKRPPLLSNPHSRDISVRENTGIRSYDNHKKKPFDVNRNCKVLPTSDNNEQKRLETSPYVSDNQFVQNEAFCSSSIQSYDNQSFEFENHSCISSPKSQSKPQLASNNTDRITAKMLKTQDCVKAKTNQNIDIKHGSTPDQRCHSENGISVSKGVVPSNEQKTQNKSTKVSTVEYVVLNPSSSRLRSSNRSYNKSRSIETSFLGHDNNRVDSSRISVENQAVFDTGVSSSLNTSLHQGPSVIHDNDFRYLSSTGSYNSQQISSINPRIQQMTQFVNPYRCLVTPQYPILNVSTDSSLYLGENASPMFTFNSLETLPAAPDSNDTQFSNLPINSLEPERSTGTNVEAITQLPTVQNKRERKERPVSSKSHVNLQYLFNIIDNILDSQKIKSASNVVREIIRVLPLKRKASISWVDKETILHAVDELSKHLENEVKLQTRRSVLRYGFQAINPNFVPDVTNTRCDIDDEEFANRYKISQGFVRDSSKDSGSDSDSEQANRLADNRYYSCWISREYSKHICMQRLSVKEKDKDGKPILFKGFKWGHPQLTADLETSFIVRPEHRVPFYHWLNKSIPSKPPKRNSGTKQGRADHVIMKVNLTKPKSDLKGLPQNLCECEFWEFNGRNRKCSVSYKYPKGMDKVIAFLAENHPLQPATFDKAKLQNIIFDCD